MGDIKELQFDCFKKFKNYKCGSPYTGPLATFAEGSMSWHSPPLVCKWLANPGGGSFAFFLRDIFDFSQCPGM